MCRWLDITVDPNDRQPNECFLGVPAVANDIPTGLARFCTAASWLSQWSYTDTHANAVVNITKVDVPVLMIENGADNGCAPSHPKEMYAACTAVDKTYYCVRNAKHYYDGQPKQLLEACSVVLSWLNKRNLVQVASSSCSTMDI